MRPAVAGLALALLLAGQVLVRAQDEGADPPKRERPKGGKDDGGDGRKDEKAPDPKERKRLAVGDEVKDLALDLAAGGTWSVDASRDKGAVLVFAAEWSKESLEALKRLGDPKGRVFASGAEVLGVMRDADAAKARRAAKDQEIAIRLAVDPKRKAYDLFAKSGLPWTVVIDGTGKILISGAGFDDEAVAKALEPPKR